MKTGSASPADRAGRILVWDAPVRLFHWLMVLSFAGAWLTAESERWRLVHVTLGYTMAGLVAFRLAWGLVGTRHARFASFVRGPRAVLAYLRSIVRGVPERHTGHNPAGALAIVALLLLAAGVTATGWATFGDVAGHWLGELHEGIATAMLALVAVHVAAVIASSWLHRENLVGSMLTGRKLAPAADAIRAPWRSVAVVLLAAVLGFWWWQSQSPDQGLAGAPAHWGTMAHHEDEDD
jgi:cytochrome b